jgi:uncharacterized protein (TIGR00295 family)
LTVGEGGGRRLPSRDECLAMLVENGCDEHVVKHCVAVADLAVKIGRRCEADVRLVEVGALLHDIGRCRSHAIDHAVRGAEIASEAKLPDEVVEIIERHIGAGIDKGEAKKLGLPEKDYIPITLEEKIVSHADNLIAGTRRTTVREAVNWLVRQGLQDVALRVLKLHEELSAVCGMNIDDVN